MDLQETLEKAVSDNTAFKEVYDLTIDRVYSFVLLRTKDKQRALDICQDIYLSFWQSLSGFTFMSEPQFWAFLFKVARRKISKARMKERETVNLDEVFDIPADIETKEDYRTLLKAMEKLRPNERLCLELRYFEDLKFENVAEAIGTTENNTKVLHHRAIKKLEKILDHE